MTASEFDTAEWHPNLRKMLAYWRSIHPPVGLPGRRHLDALAIPKELLPGVWLLDVQREPFRLRYRLVGTEIIQAIGREVTGQWLDEAHPHITDDADFFARYRRSIETGEPSQRRGRARLWINRDYREVENIILPLASDGRTVDMLLLYTYLHRAGLETEE